FLQVILLAQNRFARFLLADSKERQSLLRKLFGTERFEDVQARFDDRRRAAESALAGRVAAGNARIDEAERVATAAELWGEHHDAEVAATTGLRLSALHAARARAEYQVERRVTERDEAEKQLTTADAELATRRDDQKAQQERDRARVSIERLDAERPDIAVAETQLQQARAAEALRATITAAE